MNIFIRKFSFGMRRRLLGVFFLMSSCLALSQNLKQQELPLKVGLVLSGGGAKGLAHIGA